MRANANLLMLQEVAKGLEALIDEVVFVGGAVTGLYVDDPAAPEMSVSDDVDCVVEIAGAVAYAKLEARLRKLGFKTPIDFENNRIVCRWDYRGILVDVMPTDGKILGFSNRWYPKGIKSKISMMLPNKMTISIFTPSFFIASKLEALKNRGGSDLRTSHDLEDIVAVLDGKKEIATDLKLCPASVQKYLKTEFGNLLKRREHFSEAVLGFLQGSTLSLTRAKKVIALVEDLEKI